MTVFIVSLTVMALSLWVLLLWPCLRPARKDDGRQANMAAAICGQECRQAAQALAGSPLAETLQQELRADILPARDSGSGIQGGKPSVRMAALLWLLVVTLSGGAYVMSGDYREARAGIDALRNDPFSGMTPLQKEDHQLEKLQQQLRAMPSDSVLWAKLGEQYLMLNAYDNALKAYERALALRGENAELLSAMATVLYYRDGQQLTGQARGLIDRALAQDAHEVSALLLLASDAFFAADYTRAIDIWQTLLDGDSPRINRAQIIEAIQTARMMQRNAMP